MIIIKALAFLLLTIFVPMVIGRLITYKTNTGLVTAFLVGFLGNMAIFFVIFSFVEWIQIWVTFKEPVSGGFSFLLEIYTVVIIVITLLWVVLDFKNIKNTFTIIKGKVSLPINEIKTNKYVLVYGFIFMALLLFQMYMAFAYEINEWSYDDYDYVVTSQDNISSDTLAYVNFIDGTMPAVVEKRAITSWGAYVSVLAKVSGFEVTTVYHTILPVYLLLIAYLVQILYAQFLFKDRENRLIFLDLVSIAFIFGFYSHYSLTFRLLGAIWQGKAILVAIAVPLFILYLVEAYRAEIQTAKMLPIAAISLGMCSFTSLSVLFVPIVAVLVWALMCVYNRKIHGIRYLVASLIGPAYVAVFYVLIYMLQTDMKTDGYTYFKNRDVTHRWDKWFH